MKHLLSIAYILLAITVFTACETVDEPRLDDREMPLVVEGWIEEGESPMVIVTHAVNLSGDSVSFDDVVEKWGRVSIFDGDTRYFLIGRLNKNYIPQFIFTHPRLKGEVGHTYRLLIETETDTVESTATMLPAPTIDRLTAVPVPGNDTLYSVRADLSNLAPGGFYKIFAQSTRLEKRFYGSFLGTFSTEAYDPAVGWSVTRGIHSGFEADVENFNHFYTSGDIVSVKICTLEPALYDFWHAYDNNISLSENIFFTFAENCPSNIIGGLGYWAAYGYTRSSLRLP